MPMDLFPPVMTVKTKQKQTCRYNTKVWRNWTFTTRVTFLILSIELAHYLTLQVGYNMVTTVVEKYTALISQQKHLLGAVFPDGNLAFNFDAAQNNTHVFSSYRILYLISEPSH